jgi:hypothetical protein
MEVKVFTDKIKELAEDVQCSGKGSFGSHEYASSVRVEIVYPSGDSEILDIDAIRLTRLTCGCADGIILTVHTI